MPMPLKVTFQTHKNSPILASYRLRNLIPKQELEKYGIEEGWDILVASKHGFCWDIADNFNKLVFDVCDDHFHDRHRQHYIEGCHFADLITCNSKEMKRVIFEETGRDAVIIDDPYEDEELEPSDGNTLLWFGHPTNLGDLNRLLSTLKTDLPLDIVSRYPGVTQWTPDALDKALKRCKYDILPTGKSKAKSANRMIKAIRYGKFPIAEPLPAFEEILGPWVGDINEGLEWAKSHSAVNRIKLAQEMIRERFSPQTVGKAWYKALSSI